MDWAILTAILVVCDGLLTVWVGARMSVLMQVALEDLDAQIAEAIRSVLEGAGGDYEPPNPVQSAIAQFITQRMTESPIEAVITTQSRSRSKDGKFQP